MEYLHMLWGDEVSRFSGHSSVVGIWWKKTPCYLLGRGDDSRHTTSWWKLLEERRALL